jgi:hypothetical protein
MARAYLALWKALDVYFPGHNLLELTPESPQASLAELRKMLEEGVSWAENAEELRTQIKKTLDLIGIEPKDKRWSATAETLRRYYQEQALRYGGEIRLAQSATCD